MNQGGLIIRLIDIALIILFGFIAISDIKARAQIKLPTPVEDEVRESENRFLLIKVAPDSTYAIYEGEELLARADRADLETQLGGLLAADERSRRRTHALIEPDPESAVQLTVTAMDICTRLEIAKNIAYNYAESR